MKQPNSNPNNKGSNFRMPKIALAAALLVACGEQPGAEVMESTSGKETIESILKRSYKDQPLLVKTCPDAGHELPLGSGVQADLLGRLGVGRNFIVIGDGAPQPVEEYDIEGDGIPDAWCGPIADVQDMDTGLYTPDPARKGTAYLVIPNWEGCALPEVGEALQCPGGPLTFDPLVSADGSGSQGPTITILVGPTPTTVSA